MAKFRKKPVVVEAFQWNGQRPRYWPDWAIDVFLVDGLELVVDTLEGRMKADMGDWIIRGVKGEQYPCKPDIFEATYEPIE